MGTLYSTVEAVRSAMGSKPTAADTRRIISVIEAASRDADSATGRPEGAFRPQVATIATEWPDWQTTEAHRLWLDATTAISVSTLTSGGVPIPAADFFLEPQQYGPPYDRIEVDLSSSSALSVGDTTQRAVSITGLLGYRDDREAVGTLTAGVSSAATTFPLSGGAVAGIGDQLVLGDERVEVTGRSWSASGQTLSSALAASAAGTTLAVATPSAFAVDEVLLVDGERMLVTDVTGSSVIVRRAVDGSVLGAHASGATVYAYRSYVVTRGASGTAAVAHSGGDAVERHVVPGQVQEYVIALAVTHLLSGASGWSREYGPQGAGTKLGAGVDTLRRSLTEAFGRRGSRTRVI